MTPNKLYWDEERQTLVNEHGDQIECIVRAEVGQSRDPDVPVVVPPVVVVTATFLVETWPDPTLVARAVEALEGILADVDLLD